MVHPHPSLGIDARTLFVYGEDGAVNRGVLGVDWNEADLGDLQSFAELLTQLPAHVRRLEFAHCLGRSQESTPINIYRRMRLRVRQIENTMAHEARLEEIKVRFYVTRRGTKPTVETLRVTPIMNQGFSPRLQRFLVRNRLLHQAQILAEPLPSEESVQGETAAPLATVQQPKAATERRALWGRALVRLVEQRDNGITASATFTLLQKNPDFMPLS